MDSPEITIIIPERNEAKTLPLILIDVDRYLSKGLVNYEIIVVDSASTDSTREIVKRLSSFIKNLKLIKLEKNMGEGFAVRKGISEASGKVRLLLNPRSSVSINEIEKLLPEFKAGFGVVTGKRRALPGLSGKIFKSGRNFGFWCLSMTAVERILPKMKINGCGYWLELMEIAKRTGVRVSEAEIEAENGFGNKTVMDFIQNLKDAIKIKIWLLSGAYKI